MSLRTYRNATFSRGWTLGATQRARGPRRRYDQPDMPRDPNLPQDPAELAAALAKLRPAERYEALIDFPTDHTFKVIGAADQAFVDAVRAALAGAGFPDAALATRYSSGQKYVSITFELRVDTGAQLADLYERLSTLPGLQYVL